MSWVLWRGDDGRDPWSDDHWVPTHSRSPTNPEPGNLLAFRRAVYRVIEFAALPREDWTDAERERAREMELDTLAIKVPDWLVPHRIVLRPSEISDTDPRARDHDQHYRVAAGYRWHIYPDEHYPICACCHEPQPCREKTAEHAADAAMSRMSRYETAGVCPVCQEPVTERQKRLTFTENLEVPAGPPLTSHTRRRCRHAAMRYEQRWVAADPNRRRPTLSCPGRITNHNDGTYDCTELAGCPGPDATHPSYTLCRCPDCHARGAFSARPSSHARRNRGEPR